MHPTALLFLLSACSVAHGTSLPRALWQFSEMIKCAQPGVNPLAYSDYGCWCGFGGTGTPKDQVDRCCEVHDNCYRASRLLPECRPVLDVPYIKLYKHSCADRQVSCSASNDICQASVCECDRVAAHCFAQTTYNPENKNLDPKVHCLT
ncbi:hypothetical protein DPEC_G00262480 [Dallia pectoralis]|uniref:Uncharacterized protein n=1 Tax=Dallia pectoralis TaxID=75939 RepID=A0ACC2FRV7_DALPE|nr:hypothetical protein DPEC_G00262480 [Dallia pectoralis]